MDGYSLKALRLNEAADQAMIGVQLGKVCITKEISVIEVSKRIGVSRECVYKWFFGETCPKGANLFKVTEMLNSLTEEVGQ